MTKSSRRVAAALLVSAVVAAFGAAASASAEPAKPNPMSNRTTIQLLAFNDFHGHLEADDGQTLDEESDPQRRIVGGSEFLASQLDRLRAQAPGGNSLTVAAGDLIGGSTFLSGLFHDEPTIESMEALGLDVTSVGNHEFDEGTTELLRIQNGGCHPDDGCYFPEQPYDGADFPYLAANVELKDGGDPLLPPYEVREVDGVKVGFIGMTTKTTPALVSPGGIQDVDFLDEVETANRYARELEEQGVKSIVVLLHEGGLNAGTFEQCDGISGAVVDIAERLHPEIDAVVTGHTHEPYVCDIPDPDGEPRLVTSAASFGSVISEIELAVNRRSGQVQRERTVATNHLVTRDVAPDPEQTAIIEKWNEISGPIAGEVVGTVAQDVTGDANGNRAIETPMGDLIADAILWGTAGENGGAQISFMNIGGVRASFLVDQISNNEQSGEITYEEAFNVAPFGNLLVSMDLTGAQIEEVLEQQFQPIPLRGSRPMLALGVSEGFTYAWDDTQPQGERVVPGSMHLNGDPIDPNATYRVSTLNFLHEGGDSFTAFDQGTNVLGGAEDLQNLVDYLETHPGITPPPDRVDGL
ncbi:MAG: bifunctional metallophosphatase/5'-nucleotidase [Propionibacteriales bacterium]|nr:bifunctional metallophosphatase/5'-nucleotidase [Propionibacteriales bacterium]